MACRQRLAGAPFGNDGQLTDNCRWQLSNRIAFVSNRR